MRNISQMPAPERGFGYNMSTQRYDFPPPDDSRELKLLYVSRSRYQDDWHSLAHTHYCTELFYIVDGSGFFLAESEHFPIHSGELVVVNPYVNHTELSFAENPLEYIVLGIDGVRFRMPGVEEQNYFHLANTPEQEGYSFYMRTIFREMQESEEGYLDICRSLGRSLLLQLQRRLSQLVLSSGRASRARGNSECARIRQYMDDHFTEEISLDLLARLAHMNKHYLVHVFTKEVGCSPINYLLAKRIAESKHLLENSDHSVSQISRFMGFSSPSYFSQRFKKAVGMSPLDYRKAVQARPASVPADANAVREAQH